MVMPAFIMVVRMAVAVSAAFGLKRSLQPYEVRTKTAEHIFDYMVRANAKYLVADIGRQVSVSQMPGKTDELIPILVPDFDDLLGRGLNLEPPPVIQLQAIPIGHGDRLRKVEKNILALICGQAKAASMTRIKIESE
jgi:hypothetical protein